MSQGKRKVREERIELRKSPPICREEKTLRGGSE